MELITDNSHDMINLEGLDLSKAKKLNVELGSTELNVAVFSGSKKIQSSEINSMFNKEEVNDNERVR